MTRNIIIPLTSLCLILCAAGCGPSMNTPGDTAVETRTVDQKTEPGNILADERIKAVGE